VDKPGSNVLIAAVGGQGALLASRVLGRYAVDLGLDVKLSEVHGMSQRGGSVVTHVRFAEQVHSPVIELGTADTVIAFELLEAARYASYLRPGGTLIVNLQRVAPMPVLTGAVAYPATLPESFAALPIVTVLVDALSLAERAGNVKAVNTVLLGVYARQQGARREPWLAALEATVPPKHLAVNLAAFDLGFAAQSELTVFGDGKAS